MKKLLIVVMLCIAANACQETSKTKTMSADEAFEAYKARFIDDLWKVFPGWASSVGYHKYDSALVVPDDAQRQRENAFAKAQLDTLKKFDLSKLSNNNITDYYLIESQLRATVWANEEQKPYQWDPSGYNVGESFASILNGNYDKLEKRLHAFGSKLKNVKPYYEAAKKNIKNPTKEHTDLAIDQINGSVSVFESDLKDSIQKSTLDSVEKKQILQEADDAVKSIKEYVQWLKTLRNDNPRSFRLGKALYDKKFEFDIQSSYTADEIYQKALKRKGEIQQEMAKLSAQLWPKYFKGEEAPKDTLKMIRKMIDKLSLEHVEPAEFQASIEQQLPVLVDFIKKKDLLYIDPSKPLVVRKEPAYMQGVAGASISAPGPYDKNANTYYNVGSLASWKKEKAESYLREYNKYILQILNIHEAIPGHYTQLVYANQSPSLIKSIFGNNAMIEGWAVYTERMMLEEGYGNNEPEMWLMYYKWHLRSVCNTILDHSVHVLNMSKEEAMHLLVDQAFQQQAEAEGKWHRVQVTQVQLCCYFTGFTEIYALREEMKKKQGDKFNLKKFHGQFLSYGSAPVKYIKQMMLAEK